MSIGLAIFLIIIAVAIGILYWDRTRKYEKLRDMITNNEIETKEYYAGTAIFTRQTNVEVASEIDSVIQGLSQKGFKVIGRRPHKWGEEVWFDTGCTVYNVFVCNPDIKIPTFDVSILFIGEDLSVDQVLKIMSQHSGKVSEVHLYS